MHNLIVEIQSRIQAEVVAAFDFAEASPFPNQYEAYDDVYA